MRELEKGREGRTEGGGTGRESEGCGKGEGTVERGDGMIERERQST